LKVDNKLIIVGVVAVLVIALIVGIVGILAGVIILNFGSYTTSEHTQITTVHDGADNIELDVSTINGNVEIREASDDKVTVIYDIIAPSGHSSDVLTGTNGSRVNNNTMKITATAGLSHPNDLLNGNRGADIVVKVPRGSHYSLNLSTMNGNVNVPDIGGASFYRIDADTMNGNVVVRLHEGTRFSVDASTMNGHIDHGSIRMAAATENSRTLIGGTEAGNGSLRLSLHTMNGNVEMSY
jgi:DUF4097 and DUF4098 domain-containing protein YvlB